LKLEAVNYKSRVCDEHFSTNCFTLSRLSSEAIPSQSLELHLPSVDIIDVPPFESYDFQEESLGKYIISKITVLKYKFRKAEPQESRIKMGNKFKRF
jgi:hypothetical protein